jgi:DNA-directed RNA polymerase specialized sigma24 family protein
MTPPTHPFDDLNWDAILSRLVAALLRQFPEGPGLPAAQDAAVSAIRTLLRQVRDDGRPAPPPDELLAWLVRVACRKRADQYRQTSLELRHAESVGRHAAALREQAGEEEGDRLWARLCQELDSLHENATREERIVLDGKREGRSQADIADTIAREVPERKGRCSQPTVSRLWADLCTRLKRRLAQAEDEP